MSEPSDLALRFFVLGKPQTAGSKSAYVNPHTGRAVVTESGDKKSKARKKSWRGDLKDAAGDALREMGNEAVGRDWPTAPGHELYVRFVEVRKRPTTHLGTGRNAGVVKDWALALRPSTRPDVLKVARAAEDALTGTVWADDSQIVAERLDKVFGDQVGLDPRAEGLIVEVLPAPPYAGPRLGPSG